ncbi:hypothetical protein A6R74_16600 [Halomonas sp. ALS9]|nr:hypothetical protein A6R74_16600 [Halomonas sp. ALS9]
MLRDKHGCNCKKTGGYAAKEDLIQKETLLLQTKVYTKVSERCHEQVVIVQRVTRGSCLKKLLPEEVA